MAAPTWPGDIKPGEAATAAKLQGMLKPPFESLNPAVGTGITDDMIVAFSPEKVVDTAAVKESPNPQTFTCQNNFSGIFMFQTAFPMADITIAGGAQVTVPVTGKNLIVFSNSDPGGGNFMDITDFTGGQEGHLLWMRATDAFTRIISDAAGAGLGPIHLEAGSTQALDKFILLICINTGTSSVSNMQWFELSQQ